MAGGKKNKGEIIGMPLAVGPVPLTYRDFISGGGNRGIAVG